MIGESDDMDVLIVGSIAYDSITSPQGSAHNTLGGSATYAGLAASFHQRRLNPVSYTHLTLPTMLPV